MTAQRWVNHRLVVEEFIFRSDLGHAVEQQDVAEFLALNDFHFLPLGLTTVEGLAGFVEIAEGGIEAFNEVAGHGFS